MRASALLVLALALTACTGTPRAVGTQGPSDPPRKTNRAWPGVDCPTGHPGTLRIGVRPGEQPANVEVDGREQQGQTPLTVPACPGDHDVVFTWDDRVSAKTVTVRDGEEVTVGP